jgi:16S rRNA (guanine527-N7)-methyltransferase
MEPDAVLHEVLEESRRRGFLGPGPVAEHIDHAERALALLDDLVPSDARGLDLGSGGGVPGLVLACRRPNWRWILLDAQQRRTDFLSEAVRRLDLETRVTVVRARAEVAGRDAELRESNDVVVARSFGAPAVTAECATPLLVAGGHLVVSEPPAEAVDRATRWPIDELAVLGLVPVVSERDGWTAMQRTGLLDERYPRPDGRPAKRPLWG